MPNEKNKVFLFFRGTYRRGHNSYKSRSLPTASALQAQAQRSLSLHSCSSPVCAVFTTRRLLALHANDAAIKTRKKTACGHFHRCDRTIRSRWTILYTRALIRGSVPCHMKINEKKNEWNKCLTTVTIILGKQSCTHAHVCCVICTSLWCISACLTSSFRHFFPYSNTVYRGSKFHILMSLFREMINPEVCCVECYSTCHMPCAKIWDEEDEKHLAMFDWFRVPRNVFVRINGFEC